MAYYKGNLLHYLEQGMEGQAQLILKDETKPGPYDGFMQLKKGMYIKVFMQKTGFEETGEDVVFEGPFPLTTKGQWFYDLRWINFWSEAFYEDYRAEIDDELFYPVLDDPASYMITINDIDKLRARLTQAIADGAKSLELKWTEVHNLRVEISRLRDTVASTRDALLDNNKKSALVELNTWWFDPLKDDDNGY